MRKSFLAVLVAVFALSFVPALAFGDESPSTLNFSQQSDVDVVCVLRGADMEQGDFQYEVTTNDEQSAQKFQFESSKLSSPAGKDGNEATLKAFVKQLRGGKDLIFTSDDIDKNYRFQIKQINDAKPGYVYDDRTWAVHFSIGVENDKIKATVTAYSNRGDITTWVYTEGGEATSTVNVGFTNNYTGKISLPLSGKADLNYAQGLNPDNIEGKLSFAISSDNAKAPMPTIAEAHNDSTGNVDFGSIEFSKKDIDNAKGTDAYIETEDHIECTITYHITQTCSVAGVTADSDNPKTVQFKLTHNKKSGKFNAERISGEDEAFTFTNSYSVEPVVSSVTDQLSVEKVLDGRDLIDDEFCFQLFEGDELVATGSNSADGIVTLEALTYTKPGSHSYRLVEEKAGTTEDGVSYSGMAYTILTKVIDNGDGTLSVEHAFKDSDVDHATFVNSYEEDSTDPDDDSAGSDDDDSKNDKAAAHASSVKTGGIPKTGDDTGALFALASMIALAAGAGARVVFKRARANR